VGRDAGGTAYAAEPASASVIVQDLDLTLGKSVDKTFISSSPSSVTYTLAPRSSSSDVLQNTRVIDPFPAGLTAPPSAIGQSGTYGPYVPIPAPPGHDEG